MSSIQVASGILGLCDSGVLARIQYDNVKLPATGKDKHFYKSRVIKPLVNSSNRKGRVSTSPDKRQGHYDP